MAGWKAGKEDWRRWLAKKAGEEDWRERLAMKAGDRRAADGRTGDGRLATEGWRRIGAARAGEEAARRAGEEGWQGGLARRLARGEAQPGATVMPCKRRRGERRPSWWATRLSGFVLRCAHLVSPGDFGGFAGGCNGDVKDSRCIRKAR